MPAWAILRAAMSHRFGAVEGLNPNRSSDRIKYNATSGVKLFRHLAHFCQHLAFRPAPPRLDVARYAFGDAKSNLQDISEQSA